MTTTTTSTTTSTLFPEGMFDVPTWYGALTINFVLIQMYTGTIFAIKKKINCNIKFFMPFITDKTDPFVSQLWTDHQKPKLQKTIILVDNMSVASVRDMELEASSAQLYALCYLKDK
jgi:hypothetical protein